MNRRGFLGIALTLSMSRSAKAVALHREEGLQRDAAPTYHYVHLDVFTDQRLAGNQLLVYTQPGTLSTEAMQALTRESNYSENTFVLPPEAAGTDYRVRIFTRTAETPFAGHPTIGTAFALAHTGAIKPGTAAWA